MTDTYKLPSQVMKKNSVFYTKILTLKTPILPKDTMDTYSTAVKDR